MNIAQQLTDLTNLVNATLSNTGDGRLNLNFPYCEIDFNFKIHDVARITQVMEEQGLYLMGYYNDQILFLEYLGITKNAYSASSTLKLAIGATYPDADNSVILVRTMTVEPQRVVVTVPYAPTRAFWELSSDENFIREFLKINRH